MTDLATQPQNDQEFVDTRSESSEGSFKSAGSLQPEQTGEQGQVSSFCGEAGETHAASPPASSAVDLSAPSRGSGSSDDRAESSDLGDSRDGAVASVQEPDSPGTRQAKLEDAQRLKEAGNEFFKQQNYDGALLQFQQALDRAPADAQERAVYHCNSAACYLLLERHRECVTACSDALLVDATYQKALARRMKAFAALDEMDSALKDAQQLVDLNPNNVEARANVRKWGPIVAERQEKMKEEVMGKLKDLGNSVLGHFGMSLDNFKMEQDPNSGGYSIKMQQ